METNNNIILKAGKIAVGIIGAAVIAEGVAIAANAAVDDIAFGLKKVNNIINPEPVKAKGFWRKKK